MKIAAHPLVVAAALGLVGPAVLIENDDADDAPCMGCDESEEEGDELARTLGTVPDLDAQLEAAEEFAVARLKV